MDSYNLHDWKHDLVSFLTESSRAEILQSYKKIVQINHIYDSLDFVDFSIINIVESHTKLIIHHKYGNDFSSEVELNFTREQNYLLSNLLSAYKNYLDTTNNILSKLSKPIQHEFKEKQKIIYDSSPFYRVSYRLRNYSQHYAFPIKCAVKHTRFNKDFSLPSLSLVTPIIHKRELLEARNIWNSQTRQDIDQLPDEIDAKELIWELSSAIENIHQSIGVPLYDLRQESLAIVSDLIDHGTSSKSPSNFYIMNEKGDKVVDVLSLEVILKLEKRPSCPKLTDFRRLMLGLIPNVDLEKIEYGGGIFSVPTAGV